MSISAKLPSRKLPIKINRSIAKPIKRRIPLPQFDAAPDPIDDERYTGQADQDAEIELDQVAQGFRERLANEAERFKTTTDGAYYFVVAFENGQQAEAFLKQAGISSRGDLFVDGRILADNLNIILPENTGSLVLKNKVDPHLAKMARGFKE